MKCILNINKPSGITSHDVIDKIRRVVGIKKVGHTGTLDPMATGVLIILIDKATKEQPRFLRLEKEYVALIKLGQSSDTFDKTGKIQKNSDTRPSKEHIKNALKDFVGEILQIPPVYSAIKIKGKKMYEMARQGIKIKPQPRKIFVKSIQILKYSYPYLKIQVECGSGTYIRSLANDIGIRLNTGAYLEELIRTRVGDYKIDDSIKLEKLNKNNWKEFTIEIF